MLLQLVREGTEAGGSCKMADEPSAAAAEPLPLAAAASQVMRLTVHGCEHCTEVQLPTSASAGDAKAALEAASGAAKQRLRLIWSGRVLEDSERLQELGCVDGCCLHVAVRPESLPDRSQETPDTESSPPLLISEQDLALLEAELRLIAHRASAPPRLRRVRAPREGGGLTPASLGDAGDFWLGFSVGLLLGFLGLACVMAMPESPLRLKAGLLLGVMVNLGGAFTRTSAGGLLPARHEDASQLFDE